MKTRIALTASALALLSLAGCASPPVTYLSPVAMRTVDVSGEKITLVDSSFSDGKNFVSCQQHIGSVINSPPVQGTSITTVHLYNECTTQ
ncbi:MAG: hypothetical protein WC749_00965 [Dehalococcoidia bacterium]|uniref:hypothetical protein n=1 Tax=unclassified Pseudomonas TaxID=196821 RepID=UPI001474EAB9|nr:MULTISPECIES: hypothetical protein [unclassified Pseudomonas]NMX92492.1 hypothetical protein [Pseudomonas sp. WS 5086]NMY47230.1 hypothetical protein [Pseudomonas sp. WS 5027]